MGEQIRKLGPKLWVAAAFLVWLTALGSIRANAPDNTTAGNSAIPQNPAQAQAAPAAAGDASFVGQDTCLTCHNDTIGSYKDSAHHRAVDPRSPAATQGCESCHGPGSKHVEDPTSVKPRSFKTRSAAEADATCTTCHSRGEHALWDGSQHESRGVSCVTCHSVHNPVSEKGQLKKATQTEVCASCHRDKASKVDRSGHMPVREGKMQCSTCHNIHGSTNVKLLRKGDSIADSCVSCHADKRGPFLWEHAPGRDGCTTCHDPHGSANDRMLSTGCGSCGSPSAASSRSSGPACCNGRPDMGIRGDGFGRPMANRLPTGPGSRGGRWHDPEYRRAYHRAWRAANPDYRERERLRKARERTGRDYALSDDPAGTTSLLRPVTPRPLPRPAERCGCPECSCANNVMTICGFCQEGIH